MGSTVQPNIDYTLLKGRSAIITGGASGLGEQTTIKFAENGAYVTIADLQDDLGKQLAQRLSNEGHKVSYVHCDTTDWKSSAAAFRHAANFAPSKTLDIAALFAGIDGDRTSLVDQVAKEPIPSLDEDLAEPKLHRAININLIGVYLSSYLALQYFRLKPADGSSQSFKKSLILISSIMGYVDGTYNTDYGASKFGVRGLFRSIRSTAHKLDVRVNNIAPGYVLTPLVKRVHQIERPDQTSIHGRKLPWTPIEHVVAAASYCAVNDDVAGMASSRPARHLGSLTWCIGRTLTIMPSGFHDIDEEAKVGYGGKNFVHILARDGLMDALGVSLE